MCFLDHGYIVGTISNGQSEHIAVISLDHAYHISFLTWSKPAADDSLACFANSHEVHLKLFYLSNVAECCILYDYRPLFFLCHKHIVFSDELIGAVLCNVLLCFEPVHLEVRFDQLA